MNNSKSGRRGFFSQLGKSPIIRKESRWLAGVATGIADYFKIDVILTRGIVVVLCFLGGLGFILYGLAWALLPDEQGRIHLERALNKEWTSGMTGSVVLIVLGIFPAQWILDSVAPVLWPIAIVAAVLFIIFSRKNTRFEKSGGTKPKKAKNSWTAPEHSTALEKPWRHDAQSFTSSAASSTKYDSTDNTYVTEQEEAMASDTSGSNDPSGNYDYAYTTDPTDTRPCNRGTYEAKATRKARAAEPIPSWLSTAVVGLTILVIAAVLLADYLQVVHFPASGWVVALAAGLLVVGLSIVFVALSGRTTGGLHSVAIPLLIVMLVFSGSTLGTTDRQAIRSEPTSNEYSAVFSKSTIDLTYLSTMTTSTTVKVDSVFSRVNLKLPDNVEVRIKSDGVFNKELDGELPQDKRKIPEDAPLLIIEVDGLFSAFESEVAITTTPTVVNPSI